MKRTMALVVALALFVAACGGDDDAAADTTVAVTTPTTSATTSTTSTTVLATTTTAGPETTTTATPDTTTSLAAAGIVPGEDADVDAIVLAYSIAFDSESDYAAKAPYIDDPSGLEETVATYLTTGDTFGGISVVANSVTVNGATADVGYDLYFGSNPTYPDLTGTAVLTDEGWKVPRTVFCSLMSSARVGCP